MPAVAQSHGPDAVTRDAELQAIVRQDALEVLSLQLDVERVSAARATRKDVAWSSVLLAAAIGVGAKVSQGKKSSRSRR